MHPMLTDRGVPSSDIVIGLIGSHSPLKRQFSGYAIR